MSNDIPVLGELAHYFRHGVVVGEAYLNLAPRNELESLRRQLDNILTLIDNELVNRDKRDVFEPIRWDIMPKHSNVPNPLEELPRGETFIECNKEDK